MGKSSKTAANAKLAVTAFFGIGLSLAAFTARADEGRNATSPGQAPSWASSAVRSIRLDEALAYAESHRPSLRVAVDRVTAAQADARVPRALVAYRGCGRRGIRGYCQQHDGSLPERPGGAFASHWCNQGG